MMDSLPVYFKWVIWLIFGLVLAGVALIVFFGVVAVALVGWRAVS